MREKRNFLVRSSGKPFTDKKLLTILQNTTTEKDAKETYKRLTGKSVNDDDI